MEGSPLASAVVPEGTRGAVRRARAHGTRARSTPGRVWSACAPRASLGQAVVERFGWVRGRACGRRPFFGRPPRRGRGARAARLCGHGGARQRGAWTSWTCKVVLAAPPGRWADVGSDVDLEPENMGVVVGVQRNAELMAWVTRGAVVCRAATLGVAETMADGCQERTRGDERLLEWARAQSPPSRAATTAARLACYDCALKRLLERIHRRQGAHAASLCAQRQGDPRP